MATRRKGTRKVVSKAKMKKTRGGHNETDLEFFKPSPTKPPLKSGS